MSDFRLKSECFEYCYESFGLIYYDRIFSSLVHKQVLRADTCKKNLCSCLNVQSDLSKIESRYTSTYLDR